MNSGTKWSLLTVFALVVCIGCADNPGSWGEDKVKAQIIKSLEMDDLSLTANEEGGFTGTGKRGEETLTVKISQDPEASRLSWDAQGDRGFVEEGYYELE